MTSTADVLRFVIFIMLALAVLVFSIAVLLAVHRGRKVIGHFESKIATIDLTVAEISKSTNGVKPGEPTMIEQVRWLRRAVNAIIDHLGLPVEEAPDVRSTT